MDTRAHSHDPYVTETEEPIPPSLPLEPTIYPDCCLALSKPLLVHLSMLLAPAPTLTLSIGSGFGLLESILLKTPYNANIVGVEIQPSPNKYLPRSNHRMVAGSRFLEPLAAQAELWMFVYPRRVGLVEEYIQLYGREQGGHKVREVVWIGPTCDWEDYKSCFEGWDVDVKSADLVGGRPWETIAVARKAVMRQT